MNGVGFLYCFYCYELFVRLENSGFGCSIGGVYARIFGFSDDDIAIAPTFTALEGMMKIIENFCKEHGLPFSTNPNPQKSKTKCIALLDNKRDLPDIILDGNKTPWVDKINHL